MQAVMLGGIVVVGLILNLMYQYFDAASTAREERRGRIRIAQADALEAARLKAIHLQVTNMDAGENKVSDVVAEVGKRIEPTINFDETIFGKVSPKKAASKRESSRKSAPKVPRVTQAMRLEAALAEIAELKSKVVEISNRSAAPIKFMDKDESEQRPSGFVEELVVSHDDVTQPLIEISLSDQ